MDISSIRINNLVQYFTKKGFANDLKWSFVVEKLIPSIVKNECMLCKCKFFNEYSTKRHFFCRHEQLFPENMFEEFKKNKCQKCDIFFYRKDKYKNHMVKHQTNEIRFGESENCTLIDFWSTQKSQNCLRKRKRESNVSEKTHSDDLVRENVSKRFRFSSIPNYDEADLRVDDREKNSSKHLKESDELVENVSNDLIILDDENEEVSQMNNENEIKKKLINIKNRVNQLKIRYNLLKEQLKNIEKN